MSRWRIVVLTLVVSSALALASALPEAPLLAFGLGVLGALLAVAALTPARRHDPFSMEAAAPPRAEEAAAVAPSSLPLLETLPAPLLVIARTGRVIYANPAAHRMLPRLQAGVHFASLIRAPAFVEAVGATLLDSGERSFQFATHQGRERFFEARVGVLMADAAFGGEAQVIVQLDDRTEARRAEQLRSDFIANASHELRTPLAAILGYIETLQNHARDDPAARERFLGIMAREAGRMQRLVDDLMSLSRIEMTEHLRPAEQCSLHEIATESANALAPLAEAQGVRLEVSLPAGDPGWVTGDRDQLAQVFTNLLANAVKYGGAGGVVRVAAAQASMGSAGRIGVVVSDEGPGIPREHLPRLTERFYRVNATSSRAKGGTGLGLAIVKHILNRHEGRLEIASVPGKGSDFTIWLPRARSEAEAPDTVRRIA
jgi:two-component system phosphate regulon sensor histidine kinase PhoR